MDCLKLRSTAGSAYQAETEETPCQTGPRQPYPAEQLHGTGS